MAQYSAFWFKLGLSLVLGLSGFILAMSGYDSSIDSQSPEAIRNLRLFFVLLPLSLLIISSIFTYTFPLTRKRMLEIRQELDNRVNNPHQAISEN